MKCWPKNTALKPEAWSPSLEEIETRLVEHGAACERAAMAPLAIAKDCDYLLTEITRLRQELSAAHLGMAAVREQAAEACKREVDSQKELAKLAPDVETRRAHEHKVIMARHLRGAILAIPLPPPDSLAKVRELAEALRDPHAIWTQQADEFDDEMRGFSRRVKAALSALEPLIGKPQT